MCDQSEKYPVNLVIFYTHTTRTVVKQLSHTLSLTVALWRGSAQALTRDASKTKCSDDSDGSIYLFAYTETSNSIDADAYSEPQSGHRLPNVGHR